ncbi:ATP-binding cassette domain-containing protein [Homoserinibacter sp. YIM 151385]|uniref:ATP-binding cassette domain-containing protein n=1 Tax=Homoserinibacter sp. YIM 151385 TaxID=2985506 RepID=UPI0022F07227|nr:ABC transporter ATP-binding protein [Homoserinibacter sp. YIM 151385]WBU37331.1 ABC transporter ATP-binding protein [Homoserinibacter sp. YIM 151385]
MSALGIATARESRRRLGLAARGRRRILPLAAALFAAAAVANLLVPMAFGRIVDAVVGGGGTPELLGAAALAVAGVVLGAVLGSLGIWAAARLIDPVLARLREDFVAAALQREGDADRELVSRATDDIEALERAGAGAIPAVAASAAAVLATIGGMLALHPLFAVAMLCAVPIHILALRVHLVRSPRIYAAERAAIARRTRIVLDAVRVRDAVLAFGLSGRTSGRIEGRSLGALRWAVRARVELGRLFFRMNLAELVAMLGVLLVGALLVPAGQATLGEAATAALLVLALFAPIGALLFFADELQSALASLRRVTALEPPRGDAGEGDAGESPAGGPAVQASAPAVRLAAASAAYPDGPQVVAPVDLEIPAGQLVAVVGASGSGKTTIARLVAGMLAPEGGVVEVHGARIAELEERQRAGLVAMLDQDVHVFAGTLRDNAALAAPEADDARIAAVLRVTGLDPADREHLPAGLDTVLGDAGLALPAADQHRLALARAALGRARVVVLDEATADAGSREAGELESAARAALAGRTVISIAHRLSQAAAADRILVVEAGRVIEDGAHAELVAADGAYARLWSAWSAGR